MKSALFYMLRNRFHLGEVKFKGEILPGSQPPLLGRALFDAVQTRLTEQWAHRPPQHPTPCPGDRNSA